MSDAMRREAFDLWWDMLATQGDPGRRPNLARDSFEAGFLAGEEATFVRIAEMVQNHWRKP